MFYFCYKNSALNYDVELKPGPISKFVHFGYLNAGSLCIQDKFEEISFLLKDFHLDSVGMTETWMRKNISSTLLASALCSDVLE